MPPRERVQREVRDAGLDEGRALPRIELAHARHAVEREDERARWRDRTCCERGATATGDDRHACLRRDQEGRLDVLTLLGVGEARRRAVQRRAVTRDGTQVACVGAHPLGPECGPQLLDPRHPWIVGGASSRASDPHGRMPGGS